MRPRGELNRGRASRYGDGMGRLGRTAGGVDAFRGKWRVVGSRSLPVRWREWRSIRKERRGFRSYDVSRHTSAGECRTGKAGGVTRCAPAHHEVSGGVAGQRYVGRMEVRSRTPAPHLGQAADGGVASIASRRRH